MPGARPGLVLHFRNVHGNFRGRPIAAAGAPHEQRDIQEWLNACNIVSCRP
ncbi:MAG TPA: hypothetical protein VFK20_08965 [Vicinamibacterales bacterium]|nr:hypothetical protein [Vicinamibacterales bacterium]